jgi:predicted nucleic acid-binding Zn ribbon protein
MKRIGDSLETLFQQLGYEKKISQYHIINNWSEMVGKKIGNISTPIRVKDRVLFVKVKSTSWRTELLFQKHEILKRIEKEFGKNVIDDIRFF